MTIAEIRQAYLNYMESQKHVLIQRASLVLADDATTLFTGSGMQPLLPYLLGEVHPAGQRLANSQICLRTQDIEEVGDVKHTTCFEMLGNWSLGDYFKKEQLTYFFNFLVDELKLPVEKIYVTCFRGDEQFGLGKDEESAQILVDLYAQRGLQASVVDLKSAQKAAETGLGQGRIFYYDDAENWWSRGGGLAQTPLGDPCGGDCEFFFDFGPEHHDPDLGQPHPASDSGRFLEIGNSVFMEYSKQENGFEPLRHKNVDFGGGLERLAAASQRQKDIFKIDSLWALVSLLQPLTATEYDKQPAAFRIIVDHWRAAVWLALDGVTPSNKEQGYVMRRLIRRACLQALQLNIETSLSQLLIETICQQYKEAYPEFEKQAGLISQVLSKEEKAFKQTLKTGWREFGKMTKAGLLSGADLFKLYDTYGFPRELSLEQVELRGLKLSEDANTQFEALMERQKQRSQTVQAGEFKGGLADKDSMTVKYHTATHLMYQALRLVLGDNVQQRGSNITAERLRFDFSHPEKVKAEEIVAIENIVNEQIEADLAVNWQVMATEAALASGVLGAFGDKYGPEVKVYIVGNKERVFSREICGGPHVQRTSELAEEGRRFKVIKEGSVAAGVRRIKAVLTTPEK